MPSKCKFTYCVWLRKNDTNGPKFCLEINCTVHKPKATWSMMTDDLEFALHLADIFPLVQGGIALGKDGFLIDKNCIIGKIPRGKAL